MDREGRRGYIAANRPRIPPETMPESLRTRLLRTGFNLVPAYRGTGARITYIADDLREIRVRLPLSLRTRNYVGTIFGGSMFGAVDPIYMVMLIRVLGPAYVVWDKSSSIRFRRPGRSTLYARCVLDDEVLDSIRAGLRDSRATERTFHIELVDAEGVVHAEVEKTIHIRRRAAS
jgi:acyl-coenzyme A thioesterase PaaI-like protein